MQMPQVVFEDLGLGDYKQVWDYQEAYFSHALKQKSENRNLPENEQNSISNYLLFLQHPHVYTLGKSGSQDNLLIALDDLGSISATYYRINRGGDITYHGPGQLVVYPIFDLEQFKTDINWYMRSLEEAVILVLADYGISAGRLKGYTGVWLDPDEEANARKICAMGVRTSRWVTMHGIAFNINTNLNYFEYIVPCGISDKQVTSMEKELGHKVDFQEVSKLLKEKLSLVMEFEYISES
jgi:lipoyl(octanoyl) transferase